MNEKIIWDFFIKKTNNPFGTAAIMGNLMAESSLNPVASTGSGYSGNQYTAYVDANLANMQTNFSTDGVAYGLAQWRFHTRKAELLKRAIESKRSIGNINLQLEFIWEELQSYKTVLKSIVNATDVSTASDAFMLKYEKPGNTSDTMKKRRSKYGQSYFDTFFDSQNEMHTKVVLKNDVAKRLYRDIRNVVESRTL